VSGVESVAEVDEDDELIKELLTIANYLKKRN